MGDPCTFNLDEEQQEIVQEYMDVTEASQSEAGRRLINAGGNQLGYGDVETDPETRLRQVIMRSADAFALAAIIWVGLTLVAPVGYRAFAIPLFAVSLALYSTDRVLKAREPHVSKRLAAMIATGGDRA